MERNGENGGGEEWRNGGKIEGGKEWGRGGRMWEGGKGRGTGECEGKIKIERRQEKEIL